MFCKNSNTIDWSGNGNIKWLGKVKISKRHLWYAFLLNHYQVISRLVDHRLQLNERRRELADEPIVGTVVKSEVKSRIRK